MTIRIETDGASDSARTFTWLARHRGEIVRIDGRRRLALGTPISGARAVIIGAVLQDDDHPGPQLAGMVRVLSNRSEALPVRLVFEGRSPVGWSRRDAEAIATKILERIASLVVLDEPMAEVA